MEPVAKRFTLHVAVSSGVPIFRQIIDQVKAQLATGRLKAGEFLPSVRQVAGQLTVNPMTVSKAYSLLERDGLLENVRGKGMRVAEGKGAIRGPIRRAQIQKLVSELARLCQSAALSRDEVCALIQEAFQELES
jgi:GntR family transcriptional regulator